MGSSENSASAWRLAALFALTIFVITLPDFAFAGTDTPIGKMFCTVLLWFTGNTGKGLATVAVTIVGLGALLGKVSWGMAIMCGMGTSIIFGAAGLVDAMNAGAASGCSTTSSWS